MKTSPLLAIAALCGLAAAPVLAAVSAPNLHIADAKQLPVPLPYPYDTKASAADVDAAVDAALARAKESGKRVLIDMGGNWCPWCRMVASVMALPEMKPFVAAHFEVVMVDVSSADGKIDRNLQIPKRFNLAKVGGVPWIIVVAPDGKVLHSSYEITDEHHQKPQQMADWLASWAK